MHLDHFPVLRVDFHKRLARRFWQEAMPVGITILAYGAACAYKSKVSRLILSRCMPVPNHHQRRTLVFGVDEPLPDLGPIWLVEVSVGHGLHVDHVTVMEKRFDASHSLDPEVGLLNVERQPEATL